MASFLNSIPSGLNLETALFAFTGGVNDLFFNVNASAYTAMSINAECVSRLQKKGSKNFLFFNYYDTSMIPYDTYVQPDVKTKSEQWSESFQDALERLHESTPGSYLYSLDTDLFPRFYYYGEPTQYGYDQLGAFGRCVTGTYQETPTLTVCSDPEKRVFWDEFHPTTKTHSYIAAGIVKKLGL